MNWAAKVKAKLNETNVQQSLSVAAVSILPEMGKRIFETGEDRGGNVIGEYSTRPLYIDKRNMARTGGGRETRGGKTKFFEGGYKEYKASLGAGRDKYTLRNFGVMMRDFYAPEQTLSGNSIKYGFKQDRNKEIAAPYPQVFGLNADELNSFQKVFQFELKIRLFDA